MAIRVKPPPGLGLLKGLWVTLSTMVKTIALPSKYLATVNYPKVKEVPVPRARGVIALDQEACTVCMLCARQCPDWCIYIEGHKEEIPPDEPGGRIKVRSKLDRFDIDYALCMYCGICVEVCPFDALFWSPAYEYSEAKMGDMLHDMDRLQDWLAVVPGRESIEQGEYTG
jgi:NADH-quinone oxidoreductase subunit I